VHKSPNIRISRLKTNRQKLADNKRKRFSQGRNSNNPSNITPLRRRDERRLRNKIVYVHFDGMCRGWGAL
jgi:hypothetical protein